MDPGLNLSKETNQFDEEKLKAALEKAKKEAEEKYEAKLKQVMEELNKSQQAALGKLPSFFICGVVLTTFGLEAVRIKQQDLESKLLKEKENL